MKHAAALIVSLVVLAGCADDADTLGIGAQCAQSEQCLEGQTCLTASFKGGHCGIADCTADSECPVNARCVAHDDGTNYCFRVCVDKAECNANRDVENEANCSSNITFSDGTKNGKACVPPSA